MGKRWRWAPREVGVGILLVGAVQDRRKQLCFTQNFGIRGVYVALIDLEKKKKSKVSLRQ
jgi:hypothetical protein